MAEREQWQYMTTFVHADIENQGVREFLKQTWPNWAKPPKYTPETMIPELDAWGRDGWELVEMEPVGRMGDQGDASYGDGGWTHAHFCVFKRRKAP